MAGVGQQHSCFRPVLRAVVDHVDHQLPEDLLERRALGVPVVYGALQVLVGQVGDKRVQRSGLILPSLNQHIDGLIPLNVIDDDRPFSFPAPPGSRSGRGSRPGRM